MKGVGLWARTHPKKEGWWHPWEGGHDFLRSVISLYQIQTVAYQNTVVQGEGSAGGWAWTLHFTASVHRQDVSAVWAGTLSISSPSGQSAWEGVGVAPKPSITEETGSVTPVNAGGAILREFTLRYR